MRITAHFFNIHYATHGIRISGSGNYSMQSQDIEIPHHPKMSYHYEMWLRGGMDLYICIHLKHLSRIEHPVGLAHAIQEFVPLIKNRVSHVLEREPRIERNLSGSSGVAESHCINILCGKNPQENALILHTLIKCTYGRINSAPKPKYKTNINTGG